MQLCDRVALVTGAGSGIGRAIAQRFLREGAHVVVNDIDPERARTTVETLDSERVRAVTADVSRSDQVARMFADVEARHGRLDVLVNNAGIAETSGETASAISRRARDRLRDVMADAPITTHWDITANLDDDTWHRMIDVHLNGTFFCTRAALRMMAAFNRGSIINMAAVAALSGLETSPHYAAAKGGVVSFTRSVAREVASRNIRVNAICPGWVDTPMVADFPARVRAFTAAQIPLGRWAEPSEIAGTAVFLASDDSSYYTGQCLSPNGGLFTA